MRGILFFKEGELSSKSILFIIALSLFMNLTGSALQSFFDLPIFLDTIGTMFTAIMIGPWIGGLVGLMTNTFEGVFYSSLSVPFGLVNFGVGIVTGYFVIYFKGYHKLWIPLVIGSVIALLAPLMAAPIATYLFGGITAHGVDKFVIALMESGYSMLSSAFWGRIPYSFIDKIMTAYLVFFLVKYWPVSNKESI